MRRREFITIIGSAVVGLPFVAGAQQQAMPVIGFLRSARAASSEPFVAALRQGLSKAGFTEGKNLAIEYRWGENRPDRLPELAADLVRRRVAVIVTNGRATPAAKSATTSIPIVFVTGNDPVARGFVRSLDRPGGNVTGVSFFALPTEAKRLELLLELVPKAKTVAILLDPNNPGPQAELRELEAAGQALGRKIVIFEATREEEIASVFSEIIQAGADALFVGASAFYVSRRRQLVQLAASHKIPASYLTRQFVDAGGLMSYSGSPLDAYRRAGVYVSRILKGEKPSNLPVELPTKFELVINRKAANALGLTIPPMLLTFADKIIE